MDDEIMVLQGINLEVSDSALPPVVSFARKEKVAVSTPPVVSFRVT